MMENEHLLQVIHAVVLGIRPVILVIFAVVLGTWPLVTVTGTCLLILPSFVPCCTRLARLSLYARLNAANVLRLKGTLGQAQDNYYYSSSFKLYKVALSRIMISNMISRNNDITYNIICRELFMIS
jgi:hypothetical protein